MNQMVEYCKRKEFADGKIVSADRWEPFRLRESYSDEMPTPRVPEHKLRELKSCWLLKTLSGWVELKPFDWIIKTDTGNYFCCNDEVFNATYVNKEFESPRGPEWRQFEVEMEVTFKVVKVVEYKNERHAVRAAELDIDQKDIKLKDAKVTAIECKPLSYIYG